MPNGKEYPDPSAQYLDYEDEPLHLDIYKAEIWTGY